MTVSNHGGKRIRERIGVNKKSVERQFSLALERGYRQHELKGKLKKWVTTKVFATGKPKECIIYNNNCFVVDSNEVLITVLPVPGNLHKDIANLKKHKAKES